MIEFNLLPDVKLEYIKTQRIRRLTFTIAFLITVVSVALLLLLLGIDGLQKKHLHDLNHDISSETTKLQGQPHIAQILTVQNQLESLTGLHAGKKAASQVFGYLNSLTPAAVSINNFIVDFTQQTITITGTADALSSVTQYVDTLKCTTFTATGNDSTGSSNSGPGSSSTGGSNNSSTSTSTAPQCTTAANGNNKSNSGAPAFSNVVLSSFGVAGSSQGQGQSITYTISLSYDQAIFDITQKINLAIPGIITTRSAVPQPTDLFKASPPAASTPSGGGH